MHRIMVMMGCVVALTLAGTAAELERRSGLSDAVDKSGVVEPEKPRPEDQQAPPQKTASEIAPLRQKVSQLMFVTLQGDPMPDSQDLLFLSQYPPGGVLLPSLSQPRIAAQYVTILRGLQSPAPLLIAANMHRLPKYGWGPQNYFPPIPSLLTIAAAGDAVATTALGRVMAEHMTTLGITVHLGPCLELAPTLPGAKGDIQCLGSKPEFVAEAGVALLKSLNDSGIIAVPLGFPGGGMNRAAKRPAVLATPRAHLNRTDLLPYIRAIESGTAMIHVGNTLAPTLEPLNLPASLSSVVMNDVLRNDLGFTGVILAGPMDAEDITRSRDASDAARIAIESGADMILWNSAGQRVMKTIDEMVMAIQRGALRREVIDAADERVKAMKEKLGPPPAEPPKNRQALKLEKSRKYPQEAYTIERKSITLVQNHDAVLPLTKTGSMPVGLCGVVGVIELQKELERYLKKVPIQPIATARHGGDIYDFEIDRVTRNIRGAKTIICVLTPDIRPAGQVRLIREIKSRGPRVVAVLVGYPSSLPDLRLADAIVLSYCDADALEESMRAVADVLVGEGAVGIYRAVRHLHLKAGQPEKFSVFDVTRVPCGRLPVDLGAPFEAGLVVPYDPRTAVKKVQWDFGDGKKSKDLELEKTYTTPGEYTITLTVTDSKGGTTSGTFHAVVE